MITFTYFWHYSLLINYEIATICLLFQKDKHTNKVIDKQY
jgi:hypothetical protein